MRRSVEPRMNVQEAPVDRIEQNLQPANSTRAGGNDKGKAAAKTTTPITLHSFEHSLFGFEQQMGEPVRKSTAPVAKAKACLACVSLPPLRCSLAAFSLSKAYCAAF